MVIVAELQSPWVDMRETSGACDWAGLNGLSSVTVCKNKWLRNEPNDSEKQDETMTELSVLFEGSHTWSLDWPLTARERESWNC